MKNKLKIFIITTLLIIFSSISLIAIDATPLDTWVDTNQLVITENGTYTVYVKDAVGNVSEGYTFTVSNLDNAAPTLNVDYTITEWTKENVSLIIDTVDQASPGGTAGTTTVTITDANGNTYPLDYQFEANTSGTVTSTDDVGNETTLPFDINWIDKTMPDVSLAADLTTPTNTDVVLTITASDGQSGLHSEPFSWDGETWTAELTKVFTTNGTYTVYARDLVGNINSFTYEIENIDKQKTNISASQSIPGWTTSDHTLDVVFSDDNMIRSITINGTSYDTENDIFPDGAEVSYTNGKVTYIKVTLPVSDNQTFNFSAIDYALNETYFDYTVGNIDRVKPTITTRVPNTNLTNSNVSIEYNAYDSFGQVESVQLPDGSFVGGGRGTFSATGNGSYTFKVTDKAGNSESATVTISCIDKTAPSVNIELDKKTEGWFNNSVVVTVKATDNTSTKFTFTLTDEDGNVTTNDTGVFEITENGTYTLKVQDSLGNTTTETITIGNIDKNSPVISAYFKNEYWVNNVNTLVIVASDGESGVCEYSLDGNTWYTTNELDVLFRESYTIYVKDNAGNISSITIGAELVTEPEYTDEDANVDENESNTNNEYVDNPENDESDDTDESDDSMVSGETQIIGEGVSENNTNNTNDYDNDSEQGVITEEKVEKPLDVLLGGLREVTEVVILVAKTIFPYALVLFLLTAGFMFILFLTGGAKVYCIQNDEWKYIGIAKCNKTPEGFEIKLSTKMMGQSDSGEFKIKFGTRYSNINKGANLDILIGDTVVETNIYKNVEFSITD